MDWTGGRIVYYMVDIVSGSRTLKKKKKKKKKGRATSGGGTCLARERLLLIPSRPERLGDPSRLLLFLFSSNSVHV